MASTAVLSPLTTLRMPAGRPASVRSSARRIGRDHAREVERRDAGADANGLADGVHVDRRAGAFGELTLLQVRNAADEFADFEAADDIALGVFDGLAMLRGEQRRQLVHVLVQEFDELEEDAGAALRVGGGPFRLRCLGVFDGGAQFLYAGERDRRLHFAGCRIVDVARASARAGDALAADEMTNLTHGCASSFSSMVTGWHFNLHKSMSCYKQPLCKN